MIFLEPVIGNITNITSDLNYVWIPSRFAHSCKVNIESFTLSNLGECDTVNNFGHQFKVGNISLETELRTVTEFTGFKTTLLCRNRNDKLICYIDRFVNDLFDSFGIA